MSLNLDNFEADFARDTPYILTSPTSLKACSTLDITPNELVYRGLEEYEENLCDLPLSEIYRAYEENETRRQEKLIKCREQREFLLSGGRLGRMAVSQTFVESSNDNDNQNQTRNPSSRNNRNNEPQPQPHKTSQSQRESRSSKSSKGRNANVNLQDGSSIKRYTSAPAVNRSQSHVNFQFNRNNLKSPGSGGGGSRGGSVGNLSGRTRSRSSSGKRLMFQTSDTESTEDHINMNTLLVQEPAYFASRSVPDLSLAATAKINMDFRKLSASPRHLCPCNWDVQDRNVLSGYLRQYGDILEAPDLSFEDRKIMECLIMKRGKEIEFEKKAQEMRKLIEKERTRRWTENQLMMQSWQEKLAEKRKMESIENTRRYLQLQEKSQDSRSNLMRYLEERDRKVQKYLEDMNYKKKKGMLEKQKREAVRQLEVGNAIEKLVEEDRQHRQILRDKLQRRMEEAELRKRRRERDYFRHVAEMNRLEDIKRSVKLERIEQKTRESVEELKNQLDEKEHRAHLNYLNRIRLRNRTLTEGSGGRQKALEKVQAIHADLLKGLDEWHKKVLELHIEAQKRAELKYNQEIHRRRVRVASDRILREERSSEMLKRVHQVEAQKKDILKATIQLKESKSARVKADKDRRVQISRIRAQHAAELRQQLKDKIHPETFDRKAARAEMELRIMKRNSSFAPSATSAKSAMSASSLGLGFGCGVHGGGGGGGVRFNFNPRKSFSSKRCSSCQSNRRSVHSHSHSRQRHCNHCSSAGAGGGGGWGSAAKSRGYGPLKSIHLLG